MADRFLKLQDDEKRELLVGLQDKIKLSPMAIEKDIWVCWVLQTLFSALAEIVWAKKSIW